MLNGLFFFTCPRPGEIALSFKNSNKNFTSGLTVKRTKMKTHTHTHKNGSFWKHFCRGRLYTHQCLLENTLNSFALEKGVAPGWTS